MLKVAQVGLGWWGAQVTKVLQGSEKLEVICGVDPAEQRDPYTGQEGSLDRACVPSPRRDPAHSPTNQPRQRDGRGDHRSDEQSGALDTTASRRISHRRPPYRGLDEL